MPLVNYSFTALIDTDSDGDNIVASQAVAVRAESDAVYATIYSDSAGASAISQPGAATDSNGVLEFWVLPGYYTITSGTRTETVLIDDGSRLKPATLDYAVTQIKHYKIGERLFAAERSSGNGGGAWWSIVDATTVTEDEFSIVTGDATRSFVLRAESPLYVSVLGAAPSTDISAAIQHATSLSKNVIVDVNANIDVVAIQSTGVNLGIISTLTEINAKTDGNITATGLSNVRVYAINGGNIVGAETSGAYTAGDAFPAVVFSNCSRSYVTGLAVTAKTSLVNFESGCNYCEQNNNSHVGLFATEPASSPVGTYSYQVLGGRHNKIFNNFAEHTGDGILIGSDSVKCKIFTNDIRDSFDDGIYISSGSGCSVYDNDVVNFTHTTNSPSGIKVRGSDHHVFENNVTGCRLGISVTGNGVVNDGYTDRDGNQYYNGSGTRVHDNVVRNCERHGLYSGNQDTETGTGNNLYPRDIAFTSNIVEFCGNAGFDPIFIFGGANIKVKNNDIIGSYKDVDAGVTEVVQAIQLNEGTNSPNVTKLINVDFSGNTIVSSATSVVIALSGVRFSKVNFNESIQDSAANSLKLTDTIDTKITGNDLEGTTGTQTSINEISGSSNNYFSLNKGRVGVYQSAVSIAENNYFSGGYFGNTSIASTPLAIGLLAVTGGNIYMSKATASSADWVQIN